MGSVLSESLELELGQVDGVVGAPVGESVEIWLVGLGGASGPCGSGFFPPEPGEGVAEGVVDGPLVFPLCLPLPFPPLPLEGEPVVTKVGRGPILGESLGQVGGMVGATVGASLRD